VLIMDNAIRHNTIGILYPGEMGCSIGKMLCEAGLCAVTTTEGRSARTQQLSRKAGLTVVDSLDDLLDRSNIVISLVSPMAALAVASDIAARVKISSRSFLYVDANSISPVTVAQIADVLRAESIDVVDASILGLATQLRERGTLYLSGARANELSSIFEPLLRVKVLGDIPGQASALKMIISGIPKGMCGLFLETMLLARGMNLLEEAIEACDESYPGVMEVMRRMLPTYPRHAARREQELREVEKTMQINGVTPRMISAARGITSDLASIAWIRNGASHQWTITEVIEELHNAIDSSAQAHNQVQF
jgi:3-hydroxyisobutyrate dehydrogenase-like beta-hydroxyacid dehydrogenase